MSSDNDLDLPENVIHILSKEYGSKDPIISKYFAEKRKQAKERKKHNDKVLKEYRLNQKGDVV
jgi:hypothetical protein